MRIPQATSQLFGKGAVITLEQTIRGDYAEHKSGNSPTDLDLAAVFEAVDDGSSSRGVCPIENSTNGPVKETHECFDEFKVERLGKTQLDIGHALLRARGAGSLPVKKIYSHEQASIDYSPGRRVLANMILLEGSWPVQALPCGPISGCFHRSYRFDSAGS